MCDFCNNIITLAEYEKNEYYDRKPLEILKIKNNKFGIWERNCEDSFYSGMILSEVLHYCPKCGRNLNAE